MKKLEYNKSIQDEIMQRVLSTALPICGIAAFLLGMFFLLKESGTHTRAYTQFFMAFIFAVGYAVFRKYGTRLTVNLMVFYMTCALISEMYLHDGIRAPLYAGSMATLTFIAWYYDWRRAVAYWLLLLALGVLFIALYDWGLLPPAELPPRGAHFVTIASQFTFVLIACAVPASMLHRELLLRRRKEKENEALIAELRQQKSDLAKLEEQSREARGLAKMGYWLHDFETGALDFSDEMFALAGLEPQPATVELVLRAIHPEDLNQVPEQGRGENGQKQTHESEFRVVRPDGTIGWVFNKWWSEFNDEGTEIRRYGVSQDITERILSEQARAKLEQQYLHAQKMEAVGQLAGGVAHDFNNLLQVILGAGTLALEDLEANHKARRFVEQMLEAEDKAAHLVGQLLAFSRRQIMRPQKVALNDVITELLKMLQRVIGAHIALTWTPSGKECLVFADRSMLEQVLMNLCLNARDAMEQGGELRIATRVLQADEAFCAAHDWARPGGYAVLEVRDTGCGMTPEVMAKIFEPFFTTKPLGKGTGLGLATVYGIVRQHNGMIFPHSTPGEGTRFEIYLPTVEASPEPERAERPAAASLPGGTETVLLAEDNDSVREVAADVLLRAGYTVIEAANGGEAIERLVENGDAIQLAILDVVMPGLGGREVYDYIREHRPNLPVIFATGYTEDGIHTNFVLEKGMKLLNKPFKQAELLTMVRGFLDHDLV